MPDFCSLEQRQRVLQLLRQRERSQAWLARRLGMNESLLSHYLAGRRRVPAQFWPRIADVLGIAESDLVLEEAA